MERETHTQTFSWAYPSGSYCTMGTATITFSLPVFPITHCPVVFLGVPEDSPSAWGFCHKRQPSIFTGFPVYRCGAKCSRIQFWVAVLWAKHSGLGPEPSSAHAGHWALRVNGSILFSCLITQSWGRLSSPYLFHGHDQHRPVYSSVI